MNYLNKLLEQTFQNCGNILPEIINIFMIESSFILRDGFFVVCKKSKTSSKYI